MESPCNCSFSLVPLYKYQTERPKSVNTDSPFVRRFRVTEFQLGCKLVSGFFRSLLVVFHFGQVTKGM